MNTRKTTTLALAVSASLLAAAAPQANAWEVAFNGAITTNYIFRGIAQNSDSGAVQGGFDFSFDSGFYAGFWASGVDQIELKGATPEQTDLEMDLYGGYSGNFTDAFSYDVGLIYYHYPSGTQLNFYELNGALSYDFGVAAVTLGASWSPDFFGETGKATYYHVGVDVPLPYDMAVAANYGHQNVKKNSLFGTPDYNEWSLGISKSYKMATFDLTYHDTNIDKSKCFGGTDLCDAETVFTVSVDF